MWQRRFVFLVMSAIFAVAVFDSCVSQGGMGKNNYVASVVTDTLTVMLPDCEDEFCEVRVYGNGARFFASDYVINGCVKFCINTIPAGRHRVFIHAEMVDVLHERSVLEELIAVHDENVAMRINNLTHNCASLRSALYLLLYW